MLKTYIPFILYVFLSPGNLNYIHILIFTRLAHFRHRKPFQLFFRKGGLLFYIFYFFKKTDLFDLFAPGSFPGRIMFRKKCCSTDTEVYRYIHQGIQVYVQVGVQGIQVQYIYNNNNNIYIYIYIYILYLYILYLYTPLSVEQPLLRNRILPGSKRSVF